MTKPIVAIVGRQNVGKSTLLNRLAGKRIAITEDAPGTTRDRVVADVSWHGAEFTLIDTGGMEPVPQSHLAKAVQTQVKTAINEADIIVFLTDVRDGVTSFDRDIADMLRRSEKPVILTVNKADNLSLETHAAEFYELALGDPLPISAHHGRGTAELLERIGGLLPQPPPAEAAPGGVKIAIVGRPSVGKSMLLNALLGEQRVIVGETPGTTRDAIDTAIDFQGRGVILIDTAGIRRRGKLDVGVERHSVIRALGAIDRADVALLVLDAAEAFTAQDKHVAGYIQQALKGIMLVVNKWDLAKDQDKREWGRALRNEYQFVPYAPVLFVSAMLAEGIEQIMPLAIRIYEERNKRIPTATVNSVIQEAVAAHPPPTVQGKAIKIKYVTQADVNPPTFVFFVNDARVHFSYRRYLENRLRDAFGFTGTAIRLIFKTGGSL
ncbi:MAG: ribosome biogenesis GTPase Der [Chloroflexi bacterium RBG_16_57_8]|nr:MAG: ribosome biogenesis GTPase Der [Chloroflexi bacterium RBG_16_57_8]